MNKSDLEQAFLTRWRQHSELAAWLKYQLARLTHPNLPARWPKCPKCGRRMRPDACLDVNAWWWGWTCPDPKCYGCNDDPGYDWPFRKEIATFKDWERMGFETQHC